ncbi:MAG: Fe-S cluster assembly ATP-binding [Geobacteraceae bacterium]|nr:MAG: Fe-S cluster assembly ATP-binding [Geobacteraceae bacterium]
MERLLDVRDLTVSVGEKRILRDVNLQIAKGETVVLFGPNGCGKTSLLKAIMGGLEYRVESGNIRFKGKDVTGLAIDERARLGIGMAYQRPPAVRGVKLGEILRFCLEKRRGNAEEELSGLARKLNLLDFLERDINLGFSGGEIKRSELLQLIGQSPAFIMLDEPDSGVDLVNIHLVGQAINELLEKDKAAAKRGTAGLIVTHSGYILDYVNADRAFVMLDGTVYCSGNPRDLLEDIRTKGYEGCVQCRGQI